MQRLRQNARGTFSIYSNMTLKERIASYDSDQALVGYDIGGTIRPAPEVWIALRHLLPWNIPVWAGREGSLGWVGNTGWDSGRALLQRWDRAQMEEHAIPYALEKILPAFSGEELEQITIRESPDFYPGFEKFYHSLPKAYKLLLSRGLRPVVEDNKEELNPNLAFWNVTDKPRILEALMKNLGKRRLLYAGDLSLDVEAAMHVKFGPDNYQVDIIQVVDSAKKAHPHATIVLEKDWTGLAEMRPTLELVPYDQAPSQLACNQ